MSEENKNLVQRLFDEVWNQGDIDKIEEIYSEDFVAFYSPPIDFGSGLKGLRAIVTQMRNTFPDYHEKVEELIAEGNKVVARFVVEGAHKGPLGDIPPTGKSVCFEEVAIFRIDGGKIVEQRGFPDVMKMFRQLGLS